jgi:Ni2+-binding GTPase involved in maturation of urease and hydrogenase
LWNYLKFLVYLDARMVFKFKKAEDILMVEEVGWNLVEQLDVVESKGR